MLPAPSRLAITRSQRTSITSSLRVPQGGHLSQEEVQHVVIVAWKQRLQALKEADVEVGGGPPSGHRQWQAHHSPPPA